MAGAFTDRAYGCACQPDGPAWAGRFQGSLEDKAAKKTTDLIRRKPEEGFAHLTDEKSVFDRHDIARIIHRYINDNDGFQRAFAAVMASPQLVELMPAQNSKLAKYSTREMINVEHAMAASSLRMAERNNKSRQRKPDR